MGGGFGTGEPGGGEGGGVMAAVMAAEREEAAVVVGKAVGMAAVMGLAARAEG